MGLNGTIRMAQEKVTHSKSKGKKFVEELNRELSPEAISKTKPETQPKSKLRK